jgi:protein-glutamine gamma-glutamyltransferase
MFARADPPARRIEPMGAAMAAIPAADRGHGRSHNKLDAQSRLWTLSAAAACLLPLLLQLPTAMALAIALLGAAIAALTWRRRLPALLRLLLALALLGLVLANARFALGRDTGCALLAAMLAIKPVELANLRDARSLLGFALFAPFATFLLDQGPLSLLLGLAGATLALAALLRLSDLESGDVAQPLQSTAIAHRVFSVGKLIAVGLPLALAAFWLFPRIASPLWGVPERALARPGLSDQMSPGEWIDFMNDDTPALRVKFFGAAPPTSQMYWRGPVLWNFDGRTWTQPRWFRGLPPAAVTRAATRWDYEMMLEPTDRRQMIALELPVQAPDGTQLSLDYGLYAARPLGTLTRWRMQSAAPATFEAQLRPVLRDMALRLPDGYNPRTVALARQWRRDAGGNDAAIVDRALRWIHGDFAYTLSTPLLGRNSVDEFLFEQKAGFCEHFSSAFVVLMRAAGIPSRVVTGYVGGHRNSYGDYWLVRNSDAHAWAEVWLQGRGWVRVDPTAAVAPERIYDTLDDRGAGVFGNRFAPVLDVGDWMRRGWNDFVLGFDAARQRQLLRPFGIDRLGNGGLIALFAAIGGLALGWMLWLTARGERERDPLLRAWHRLGARHARLGLGRAVHEPAADWAARVAAARPGSTLPALSARFADWRYAHHDGQPQGRHDRERNELIRDLRRHRP